ncbi:MAG: GNAT family N-acetyltransferase [Halomonadaceae bacterium]|nr:MAG: GNAT family N-acetyltransferase [Halomonadaceae bacterium]
MSVRVATLDDAEGIAGLVNRAYRPEPGAQGWTHESGLVTGARIQVGALQRSLQETAVLLAFSGDELIGCVQVEGKQGKEKEAHVGMLAIAPAWQTGGFGKRLLAAAEAYGAGVLGVQVFVLIVIASRRELIEFYLRRGYRETGESLPYPVAANVGTPLDPATALTVLRKQVSPDG